MTDGLTGEALAARQERVAASNRAFGKVLSIIGGVLAAVAFVLLVGGGLVMTAVAGGPDDGSLDSVRGLAAVAMGATPGVILLLAMCGLVAGEQLRRGAMKRNPVPPDTVLPSASMVSRFRVLPIGWHVFWIVVGLVVSLLLVGLPVISWFTGGWPASVGDENDFSRYWLIYGSIGFGVTVAAIVSLIKKLSYYRAQAAGKVQPGVDAPGRRFWRFFDYRWRFDLWLAGLGGVILVLALTPLSSAVGATSSSSEVADALPWTIAFCALGVVMIVAGIVCATNFWRAGEELGSGESAA
ncbi:hypothetical protein ACIRCZ_16360 [Leifsonia sp. NPDC102414]|uniref:hypothetical protein n=1 Tax=Leifsonia sp. NPDC102414 TaxID=3364124 RepID=UPI0037F33B9E